MSTPTHYKTQANFDLLDAAIVLGIDAVTFTAMKYVIRAGRKSDDANSAEKDITKATDYIFRTVPDDVAKQIKYLTWDELASSLTADPTRQKILIILMERQFAPYALSEQRMAKLQELLTHLKTQHNYENK